MFIETNISTSKYRDLCIKIVEALPEINLDVDCDGIQSRQVELFSLYKCLVANLYTEDYYKDEIQEMLEGYNYEKICDKNGEYAFTK